MQHNCGKKSISLNLKRPEGVDLGGRRIIKKDVVVENFRPGTMKRFGLDYDSLREINPKIIMCSISGYGQYGPWKDRPGYAASAHAVSGLMWVTGKTKDPEHPPMPPGAAFGDTGASLHAATAICAALFARDRTGMGEYIDVSLLDCVFDQQDSAIETYVISGGEDPPFLSPVYEGRDGWATIHVGANDRQWELLLQVIERPELLKDNRFYPIENRMKNRALIDELISEWLKRFEHIDEALEKLEKAGIVGARILSIPEALEHPQIRAREMMVEVDHPVLGKVPFINTPFRLKNSKAGLKGLPPEIGEHNEEILSKYLGYSGEKIAELKAAGILYKKAPGEDER
jgi:crotonobetainyl-CoA:carnitine CoA-transferase CaiB-like acyl-CoA transferase